MTVADARFAKPIDAGLMAQLAAEHDLLVTVEEGVLAGGFGIAVWETLNETGATIPRILRVGLPDRYVTHGKPALLHEEVGFTGKRIAERVQAAITTRDPRDLVVESGPTGTRAKQVKDAGIVACLARERPRTQRCAGHRAAAGKRAVSGRRDAAVLRVVHHDAQRGGGMCDVDHRDEPVFVSRGGIKLENALAATGLDVAGRRALDVGASTGGFTDCLLQRGAAGVIAVDVGYGQLDWGLRNDPRVTVLERSTRAR